MLSQKERRNKENVTGQLMAIPKKNLADSNEK